MSYSILIRKFSCISLLQILIIVILISGCGDKVSKDSPYYPQATQVRDFTLTPAQVNTIAVDDISIRLHLAGYSKYDLLQWSSDNSSFNIDFDSATGEVNVTIDSTVGINKNLNEISVNVTVKNITTNEELTSLIKLRIPNDHNSSGAGCTEGTLAISPDEGVVNANLMITLYDPDLETDSVTININYPTGELSKDIVLTKIENSSIYLATEFLSCNQCIPFDQVRLLYLDESANDCEPKNSIATYLVLR
ncbi:MAG: hypothetical protein ACN4E2_02385 [Nitrospinota bacterium]